MTAKTNLRPFSGDYSICPKCRGSAMRAYCDGIPKGVSIWGSSDQCRVQGEHLHRNCVSCGYAWLEECADHKAQVSD